MNEPVMRHASDWRFVCYGTPIIQQSKGTLTVLNADIGVRLHRCNSNEYISRDKSASQVSFARPIASLGDGDGQIWVGGDEAEMDKSLWR